MKIYIVKNYAPIGRHSTAGLIYFILNFSEEKYLKHFSTYVNDNYRFLERKAYGLLYEFLFERFGFKYFAPYSRFEASEENILLLKLTLVDDYIVFDIPLEDLD